MLPKENRLRTDYDFRRVKNRGTVVHTPYYTLLHFQKSPAKEGMQPSRFGFIASKKFDKRAVARNRARRLLREAVRHHLPKIKDSYDIVLIAKHPIKDANYEDVNASFNKILPKVPFA